MRNIVRTEHTLSSPMCATRAQTPVRRLRILNSMDDTSEQGPGPAAQELRRLRKKAGIGFREMARLCEMPFTQYRHYEVKLKSNHLPPDIYFRIRPILMSRGITVDELRALLHEVFRDELQGVHDRLIGIERLIRGEKSDPSK